MTLLGDADLHLFNEGTHARLYDKLGAHPIVHQGREGTYFAVWAPNAESVAVVGDFNGWTDPGERLTPEGMSGIWAGFLPGIERGTLYKYRIVGKHGHRVDKADPVGIRHELPPRTASVVWDLDYSWRDGDWMASRAAKQSLDAPMSIYELHLGSWMRLPEQGDRALSYRELAPRLIAHMQATGFTHVELMPIMEHPFYGSWGYQVTGYFAATSRYGTPQDLMFLIDELHRAGIGVILDWVPAHFPNDEHGLAYFDGTHLYEHADERQGFHPDWKSAIFNYDRHEVKSFLLSSAMFWLDQYHVDGLRVDGVASMLYLDYGRKEGEWVPNRFGGKENLGAIDLLRQLNTTIYATHPDVQTIAEESTAWPGVSRPTYTGGLGFGFKWDMGWMHDTLAYLARDPIHRRYHHHLLTFRGLYAWHENYVLALSHDEVVHGKGSLLGKMAGDLWQKFANLRLLYAYQWLQPGKKLLFMGGELAQWREWDHDSSLDWHLPQQHPEHRQIIQLLADLNRLYRELPALHQQDTEAAGFEWIEANDGENGAVAFERFARDRADSLLAVVNFTPVPRHGYRVGVRDPGRYRELLNTDADVYGGSGMGNAGWSEATGQPWHGREYSLALTLPPLGALLLRREDPTVP